jgi:dephospho-CoA kinase
MIRIGIVGDIGSGKTFVSKQFGFPVFNADAEVLSIYKKSKSCFLKLKKKLPKHIFSFPINKLELLEAIMENKNNINKINKVVHSEVRSKMDKFIKKNYSKKIIILDIPLLLEAKINKKDDFLIFVDAQAKEIKKRLKERPNFDLKIFNKLKSLQLPLEFKKKKSDFIIKNNFKRLTIKKNVRVIKNIILKNERSRT